MNKKYCLRFKFIQREFELSFESEEDFKVCLSNILISIQDKSMFCIQSGIIINLANLIYMDCLRLGKKCQYNIIYNEHNHIKDIEFI